MALANGGYGESLIPLVGQAEQVAASMQARRLRDLQEQRAAAEFSREQGEQNRGDAIRQKWAEARGDLDAFKRNGGFGLMDPQLGMQLEDVFTKRANATRDRRELEGQREALAKRFEGFQGANPEQFVMPGTPAYFEEPAGVGAALSSGGAKYASGAPMPQYGAIGEDGLPVEPMGAQTPPVAAPQTSVRNINTLADIAGANAAYDESQADAAEMRGMGSLARAGIFDNRFGDAWKVISEEEKRPLLRAKEARAEATAAAKERNDLAKAEIKARQEELKTAATLALEEYKQGKMDARTYYQAEQAALREDKRLQAMLAGMDKREGQRDRSENRREKQSTFMQERGLRKDFEGLPEVKDYNLLHVQFGKLDAAYQSSKTSKLKNAEDQAAVMMFNKILDPLSVVRESEFNRVPEYVPLWHRLKGKVEAFKSGGIPMTQEDRKNIYDMAKRFSEVARQNYDSRASEYRDIAIGYDLNPDNVVTRRLTEKPGLPAAHKSKQPAPTQGPTTIRYDAQGRRIP